MSETTPAAKRSRRRRQYANDQEIDRLVKAVSRHGLTPRLITFHPDGGVTIAQDVQDQREVSAYDRWEKRQASAATSR